MVNARLLKIWEILSANTNDENSMGTTAILEKLKEAGFKCDRRTLYTDIKALNNAGYEINQTRSTSNQYYSVRKDLDVVEAQILCDAVKAAAFITPKKTDDLIKKIYALSGLKCDERERNATEFMTSKSDNETIYGVVNEICYAIKAKKQIQFNYTHFDERHNRIVTMDGDEPKIYTVDPHFTVFNKGGYYLVSYNHIKKEPRIYKIDRIKNVLVLDDDVVEDEISSAINWTAFINQLFDMYSGEEKTVKLTASTDLLDHIFDKFGPNTVIEKNDDGTISFVVDAQVSPTFLGWCCSFGDKLKVVEPSDVAQAVKERALSAAQLYK